LADGAVVGVVGLRLGRALGVKETGAVGEVGAVGAGTQVPMEHIEQLAGKGQNTEFSIWQLVRERLQIPVLDSSAALTLF
jgi:Holliday junction resolvasome RuvABC DNA-binding subunit